MENIKPPIAKRVSHNIYFGVEEKLDTKKFFDPSKKIGMQISSNLLKEGVVGRAMPHGDILGLAPPLCLSKSEVDIIIDSLKKAINNIFG